jgi:hypothetical protein
MLKNLGLGIAAIALMVASITPSMAANSNVYSVSIPSSGSGSPVQPAVSFTTANGGFRCFGITPHLDDSPAYTFFSGTGGANFPGPAGGSGTPKFPAGSRPTLNNTGKNIQTHYYISGGTYTPGTVLFDGNNMAYWAQKNSTGYYYGNSGIATFISHAARGGAVGTADDYSFAAGNWTGDGNNAMKNATLSQFAVAIYTAPGSANNPDTARYNTIWFHMTPNNNAKPCFVGSGATGGTGTITPTFVFHITGTPDSTFNFE